MLLASGVLLVVVVGVRVIRAKNPTPEQDSADIAKWEKVKRRGFLAFCLQRAFPFILGFCILGPFAKSWAEVGSLSYALIEVWRYVWFAPLITLIIGGSHWLIVRAGAIEARERLAKARE